MTTKALLTGGEVEAPPAKRTATEWEAARMKILSEQRALLGGAPNLFQWRADRWHPEDQRARALIAEGWLERRARDKAAAEFDETEERLVALEQRWAESAEPLSRAFAEERDAMFAEAARLQAALDVELRESKEVGKALAIFAPLAEKVMALRDLLIRGMAHAPDHQPRQNRIPNPTQFIQSANLGELVGRADTLRRGRA